MRDVTEEARRQLSERINSAMADRGTLEAQYGQVWNTEQLKFEFEVHSFAAPFIFVTRKRDGQQGSMLFQHMPRFYFAYECTDEVTSTTQAEDAGPADTQQQAALRELIRFADEEFEFSDPRDGRESEATIASVQLQELVQLAQLSLGMPGVWSYPNSEYDIESEEEPDEE